MIDSPLMVVINQALAIVDQYGFRGIGLLNYCPFCKSKDYRYLVTYVPMSNRSIKLSRNSVIIFPVCPTCFERIGREIPDRFTDMLDKVEEDIHWHEVCFDDCS
ncbi:hypothetical protein DRO97_01825 [Archaeoglobales archaeon]|nr:MAG: hypothetical protein DRO97_01825 [Archaeoglobales archaeon]